MPPKLKTRPTVVLEEQQGGGHILKWLTEEEFESIGRYRFYQASREAQERLKYSQK